MLKWVSMATRQRRAWLTTTRTTTTNAKNSSATAAPTTKIAATAAHALTSKSTSIKFAMWLLTTLCIMAALVQVTNGFKPIDANNSGECSLKCFLFIISYYYFSVFVIKYWKNDNRIGASCFLVFVFLFLFWFIKCFLILWHFAIIC